MIDQNRDKLDVAIDRVATKLVSVDPDERMVDRITSRLPERSTARWIMTLAPQFAAAIGVALLAFFLFSNRPTPVADPPATHVAAVQAPIVEAPPGFPSVVPPTVVARKPPAVTPVDNTFDRDFGLKPVAGPKEITFAAIEVSSAEVAPIVLTDLPLASDSPSPR